MVCILTLLGLAPALLPIGRGFLEAIGAGMAVEPSDVLFRCNIISTDSEGRILSSCPDSLTEMQLILLTQRINQAALHLGMTLVHTEGYKLLLFCKELDPKERIPTQAPHQYIGERFLPPSHPRLRQFLQVADPILAELSTDRLGYRAAIWDFSAHSPLPSFRELWGEAGAMVCGTAIAAGIGRALGMETILPKGATGDVDTDLSAKLEESLRLLEQYPQVFCHINGTDEASHRRDPLQKAAFLRKIDRELLAPLLRRCPKGTILQVCSDHGCSSVTGRHFKTPIPLIRYIKS